MEYRYQKIASN